MSGATRRDGSLVVQRSLTAPGSLAEAVLRGEAPARVPLLTDPAVGPARSPARARLTSDAFGVSGDGTRTKLERVLAGEGFFVSTGHQPILFLGPLYVVHKALTAIGLAERLERAWAVPVVPLFWIASDDHDWDEVGTTTLLGSTHDPVTLSVPPPAGRERRPVGPTRLGPAGEAAVDTLRQNVGEYPFTERYLDLITEAYGADATFSEAFAATLSGALEDRGYAWLDASGAAVKSAASELYLAMLDASEAILEADDRGRAAIRDAGHEAPIARLDGALPIFVDGPDGRARLIVDGDRIRSGRGGAIGSVTEWRSRLRDEPERFSPNVASRPALESYLLPVAATVLGPGEIAYWSQLPPLFEALDVPFPAVHPRAAWTVIEPNIRRLLEKLDLDPDGLADGGAEASRALTEAARPETVETELEGLRALAAGRMDGLEAAVGEQLPGLKAAVGKTRKAIAKAVDQLARQVDQNTRGRLDVQLGQIRRCAAHLFPGRRPQERVLSPIPYLARHGAALIDDLAERTDAWLAASLAGPGDDG